MGCWNGTCMVSHMPIEAGDPVVGFLVARSKDGSHSFHGQVDPGDSWQAVTLPFFGEYDDYGGVENVSSLCGDFSTGVRKPGLASLPRGITVAEAVEQAQDEDEVTVDMGGYHGTSPLGLVLVHRELWDALSVQAEPVVGDTVHLDRELGRIDEFLETARSIGHFPEPGQDGAAGLPPVRRLEEFRDEWSRKTGGNGWFAPYVGRFFTNSANRGIHPFLRRHVEQDTLPAAIRSGEAASREVFEVTLRMTLFDMNMGALRRTWAPQAGMGSQDTQYEVHARVAKWVDERAATLTADDGPRM